MRLCSLQAAHPHTCLLIPLFIEIKNRSPENFSFYLKKLPINFPIQRSLTLKFVANVAKKGWNMGVVSFYLFFLFIERGKEGGVIIHEGVKFGHNPSGNVYLS